MMLKAYKAYDELNRLQKIARERREQKKQSGRRRWSPPGSTTRPSYPASHRSGGGKQ